MELAVFVIGESCNPPSTEDVLEHSYNAKGQMSEDVKIHFNDGNVQYKEHCSIANFCKCQHLTKFALLVRTI